MFLNPDLQSQHIGKLLNIKIAYIRINHLSFHHYQHQYQVQRDA